MWSKQLNAVKWGAERIGVEVTRGDYYGPNVDFEVLDPALWSRRSELRGVRFDLDRQVAFFEGELSPFLEEFRTVEAFGPSGSISLDNLFFEHVDAELLYTMIRARRPRRIVEIGSGFSTLVAALAARRNAAEGAPVDFLSHDPFPRAELADPGDVDGLTRLELVSGADVPEERFRALEAGDLVVFDTTHTVKLGGEVIPFFLDVLPLLASGVRVSIHDIFLPYEYPREWIEHQRMAFNEQYLLQCFLAFNDRFETLFAAHAVARDRTSWLRAAIPAWQPQGDLDLLERPSAYWLEVL